MNAKAGLVLKPAHQVGRDSTPPHVPNLDTRRKQVVSFTGGRRVSGTHWAGLDAVK